MPMMDVPMVTGDQMMIERRVGNSENRGLSPIVEMMIERRVENSKNRGLSPIVLRRSFDFVIEVRLGTELKRRLDMARLVMGASVQT